MALEAEGKRPASSPVPSRPVPSRPSNSSLSLRSGREPLLTRAQLDAWASFGAEWNSFKEAWIRRGFYLPPTGSIEDDAESQSQRHVLWEVLDARPTDLVRWVKEAPGRTSWAVTNYVVERFHAIRDETTVDEDQREAEAFWVREQQRADAKRTLDSIKDVLR